MGKTPHLLSTYILVVSTYFYLSLVIEKLLSGLGFFGVVYKRFGIRPLSPARWHGKHTYLSCLGILGKKGNYFPKR